MNTRIIELFRLLLLDIFFIIPFLPGNAYPQSHDVLFRQNIEISINPTRDDKYAVTSLTKTNIRFLSERSKDVMSFFIHSGYIEKVTKINYSFDGKNYDKSDADSFSPEPSDVLISDETVYQLRLPKVPQTGDELSYEYKTEFYAYEFLSGVIIPKMDSLTQFTVSIDYPKELHPSFIVIPAQESFNYKIDSSSANTIKLQIDGIPYHKSTEYFNANDSYGEIIFSIKKNAGRIPGQ